MARQTLSPLRPPLVVRRGLVPVVALVVRTSLDPGDERSSLTGQEERLRAWLDDHLGTSNFKATVFATRGRSRALKKLAALIRCSAYDLVLTEEPTRASRASAALLCAFCARCATRLIAVKSHIDTALASATGSSEVSHATN